MATLDDSELPPPSPSISSGWPIPSSRSAIRHVAGGRWADRCSERTDLSRCRRASARKECVSGRPCVIFSCGKIAPSPWTRVSQNHCVVNCKEFVHYSGMRNNFEFLDLRAFLAVLELSSFHEAATVLHLSPPALSRRIRGLEEAVGAQLIERTTRRVAPTQIGRELAPWFAVWSMNSRNRSCRFPSWAGDIARRSRWLRCQPPRSTFCRA